MNQIMIAKNICKKFKQGDEEIDVLQNFNVELNSGEIKILKGPSGSGKTTLLQILGLMDDFDEGSLEFPDQIIKPNSISENERTEIRAKNVAFIHQFHYLIPEFSALENAAMPLLVRGENREKSLQKAQEILCKLELSDRLNHFPAELSGGQRQRVAVARAIAHGAKVILADEPTGILDEKNATLMRNYLKELLKEQGIGAIIASHDSKMEEIADEILEI